MNIEQEDERVLQRAQDKLASKAYWQHAADLTKNPFAIHYSLFAPACRQAGFTIFAELLK